MRRCVSPTNCAYSRNETHPISAEYENENRCKEPKGAFDQVRSQNSFEKVVETFNKPLQKILCATWYLLHLSGSELRKNDQAQSSDPTDDHRIGDWEAEHTTDLNCLLR